jgi:hypothetical protein
MSSAGNKWKSILLFQGNKLDAVVIYGAILLFLVKLLLFPITDTVDADAVSRTLISYNWTKNPHFITDSVWAPLHFYMNGIIIWLTGAIENGPRLFNVLLSCLTLIPFYYYVKWEFNAKGAVFSTMLIALSPILFRNSFQALSGTPYLFFLAIALCVFSRALRRGRTSDFIWSGLALSIAAGFRYEAWIILAVFTLIGVLRKQWKGTVLFWTMGMIIPLSWMLVGWIWHGDFLYGINGAYGWNIERMDVNADVNATERLKRLFFFPMSWFLSVSPIIAWVIVVTFFRNVFKKRFTKEQYFWLLPLLILGIAFLVKAQDGTLLLQHRFSASLVFFSAPLLALVVTEKTKQNITYLMTAVLLLVLPQSYFWYRVNLDEWTPMSRQIKSIIKDIQLSAGPETLPLPQIDNPLMEGALGSLASNWKEGDGLIVDFFGWSETYYMAMQYPQSNPFIFPGAKNDVFPSEKFLQYLMDYPQGKLVLHCASNHDAFVEYNGVAIQPIEGGGNPVKLELLYSNKGLSVFEYKYANSEGWTIYPPTVSSDCAEIGSVAYFESKAYFSVQQKEAAKRIMRSQGITFEAAIYELAVELNTKYLNGEIEI